MNIDNLKTFISVVRTRSFTKAAEENFCTQSTASLRIKSLEDHFGIRLFDRIGKAVYLTNDGQLLLPYIELAVDNFDQARELVQQIRKLSLGKVSIIASQTPGTYIIPQILLDFHKKYPKIIISSRIAYAKIVINQIAKGNQYDLGIISQPEHLLEKYKLLNIEIKEIINDPLMIMIGKDHPWASRKEVKMPELIESTIFLSNQNTSLISYLHYLTGQTIKGENKIVMGSLEAVKVAVQSGEGFSVQSVFNVKEELRNGTIKGIRLKGYELNRKICFILKKNKIFSPAMQTFLNNMTKWVEEAKW